MKKSFLFLVALPFLFAGCAECFSCSVVNPDTGAVIHQDKEICGQEKKDFVAEQEQFFEGSEVVCTKID